MIRKMANVFILYVPALVVMAFGTLCLSVLALGCFIPPQKRIVADLKEVWDNLDLKGAWREMMS